jgi:hypothetical protein
MGAQGGDGANLAQTLFTSLNAAFRADRVRRTACEFRVWLAGKRAGLSDEEIRELIARKCEADDLVLEPVADDVIVWGIYTGQFYEHLEFQGWIPDNERGDRENSRISLDQGFEPGSYDIIGHVVVMNLCGRFSNVDPERSKTSYLGPFSAIGVEDRDESMGAFVNAFYPRPMEFVRAFSDVEEIIVRSTRLGIKVIVQTLVADELLRRSEARARFGKDIGYLSDEQRVVVDAIVSELRRSLAERAVGDAKIPSDLLGALPED